MGYEKERAREVKSENSEVGSKVRKIKFKNIIKTKSNTVTINTTAKKKCILFSSKQPKRNKTLEIKKNDSEIQNTLLCS